jgi:hypothetical protein
VQKEEDLFDEDQGYKFNSLCPNDCPPQGAEPAAGQIFRGIRKLPISEDDFLSHREMGADCRAPECECWGLSVWPSLEAVEHARRAIPAIKRHWHIAVGDLVADDGVIIHTPKKAQPEHYTLWRDIRRSLSNRFRIVIAPANR